jgi:hypothetical protein
MGVNYCGILTPRKIRVKITVEIYRSIFITLGPGGSMHLSYVLKLLSSEKSQH